ncbi:MBG domain-containing protein [Mesorhizobium loti]|nr:MBG domain-containing protein [Mesorhizobium loti]
MQRQPLSPRNLNRTSAPLMALLLASTALVGFTSARAQELPTGGSVASGGVTISNPSSSQLSIKQSTSSAIVNWQGFSIGAGGTVNIDQPTSTSTMLNRVTGGTSSTIAGQLNANGQVFLVNPNGIAISKTGKVSAAGFVGSTLGISDEDFKAGKLSFEGKGASAAVSNRGAISIGRGGYAALIGGSVDNAGSISVPLGKVGLGSGEKATLDLSGDGFLQVSVPTKADGSSALVSNSGLISADGGTVELKAAAVRNAARQAVNMSGVIEARTVSGQSGAIVLGGDQGSVEITGTLDASAKSVGKGGKITVTGRKLKLKAAKVDASGKDGGGTIKIGGDYQGSGTLQHADTTEIDAATTIKADATGNGNGGTVIVWSDAVTGFEGMISARGGEQGGNGGSTEVSSHGVLDFDGNVDLSARFGDTGYLLLDPYNLTIQTNSGSPAASGSGGTYTASGNNSILRVSTLQSALANANVTVTTGTAGSQTGDITVANAVTWSSGNSLTLSANRNIAVNASLTSSGGGAINLRADSSGTGTGTVSFASSAIKASTSGVVSIYYNPTVNPAGSVANATSYTNPIENYSGNIAGGGTLNAAMLVNTLNDLRNIKNNSGANFALGRSIDATGAVFTSAVVDTLNGTFDGLGNTISNLAITSPDSNVGLFGDIAGSAIVRNLKLTNVAILGTSGSANSATIGGLAGSNEGTVSAVTVSGSVRTVADYYRSVGGLIGFSSGTISGAISTAAVQAGYTDNTGGLVGALFAGSIAGSSASGSVSIGGQSSGGGLVGEATFGASITGSFATGTVTAGNASKAGGLAGNLDSASIATSYSSSTVYGDGSTQAGGLVGSTRGTASIGTSYATGAVNASQGYIGGLVGASLDATTTVTNSYATGTLTGATPGGIVGYNSGSIASSYFDLDTTGATAAAGWGPNTATGGTGLHTSDFLKASSFTGWTFGTTGGGAGWVIVDADSTLNNAGGAAGGTRPMLLSEYSTTITNAHQLQLMALNLNGKYTLGNNIDASTTAGGQGVWGASGFVPIGSALDAGTGFPANSNLPFGTTNEHAFTGTFDGKGLTISNLFINRPTTDYVGLFGYANAATLQNVTLTGGSITGRDHVGALLGGNHGYASDGSTYYPFYLMNVSASAAVSGRDYVGGLAGSIEAGYINDVSASGAVSGRDYVGGLAGYNNSSSGWVEAVSTNVAASATGAVSGRNNVGGLFGYVLAGFYNTSYATGTVTATGDNVGGLFGQASGQVGSGPSDTVYATGAVTGRNNVGGLIGLSIFSATQAYATGAVTGVTAVGGLVGNNDSGGYIDTSFANGVVRGVDQVGGLVGRNLSIVGAIAGTTGTYATGAVYGTSNVGGLVGLNGSVFSGGVSLFGRVQSSYAIGFVSGTTNVGGLVGNNMADTSGNNKPATVKTSYWDTDTAGGGLPGIGAGVTTGTSASATGKTTAQLMAALQTGFSSSTWGLVANTSLPYFKWLYPTAPQVVTGTAYSDRGTTPLAGVATNILVNGTMTPASAVGSTGANGYYYFLLPNGTIAAGGSQLLVSSSGPSAGATFQQNATGSLSGLSIYGGYLKQQGAASTLSALNAARATALGSNAAALSLLGGLSNVEIDPASAFTTDQAMNVPGTLVISSTGAVSQTASISANSLLLLGGGGSYTLANSGNAIGTLAASTGTVSVTYNGDLTIGAVAGIYGVTASGAVTVKTPGKLTIASAAKVTAGSNANVVLSAGSAFVNNRGSDAVSVSGTGRWLIYSANPGADTFGGLDSANTAIWNTAAGGAVPATGNRYVFAYQPTLTFTSTNASMVYGDSIPTLTYSVSGYQAGVANAYLGDSATTAFTGAPTLSTPATLATQPLGAGSYTITIDAGNVGGLNGYAVAFNSAGLISVAKRMVTVSANSGQGKTYGDADPSSYGYTYSDLGSGTALVGSLDRDAGQDVGTYAINQGSLTNAANANYDISFVSNDFTIAKRAITVTATAGQGKTYGNADPSSYGYTYSDLGTGAALVGSLDRASGEDVGSYAIGQGSLTNASNSNYDISFVSNDFSIGKRAVTVTATAGQGKTYGNADPSSYGYTYSDLGTGAALVGSLDRDAGEDVGTYAIGQGSLSNANNANYDITYVGSNFSIGKRAITVTADTGQGKTYGNANPSSYGYAHSDLGTGVALVGALDRDAGEDVGTYAIGQGTLTDANNSNYDISYTGADFSIGKRSVTVTATAGQGKAYGDSAPASYSYTYSDLGSGAALVGALDRDVGEDVGTYAIGQGTLTDAANSNYDITYVGGSFSIGKRAVTVTATAGLGKTYGNADPSSYDYTYSDLGTGVALVGALDRASGEDVGSYAIGQGTLTNGANSNYDISFVSNDFSVGKRAITVTATAGQGKTYGNADPSSYLYSYSDLGTGVALVGSLDRTSGENVGSYAIGQGTLTNGANSNYDISFVSNDFSIGKRAVTVTAAAGQGKIYGDADPSSYGYSYSDLGNGTALVGALDRVSGENVGNYAIGRGTLTDAANSNYDITYVDAGFSIGKRSVTVTADAGQGKTYGDIDPSSYSYTFTSLGTGVALVGALDRAAGETVGDYAIGQGSITNEANSNYDISYAGAHFSIAKRSVTVTANAGQGKVYGDADPSSYGYSYSYLGNGVALVGALDRAAGENAGSYAIGQGTLTNTANANYDITYVSSDFTIGKRPITVVADAQSRPQGTPNPAFTYTIGGLGLVGSDTLTGALSTDATPASIPGIYAIEQGSLTASANYELTYIGADLVVSAPNTVPASDAASTVAHNTHAHGAGAPAPVFFTGQQADGDTEALVEDPRLGGFAFCQGIAQTASVCTVASVQ